MAPQGRGFPVHAAECCQQGVHRMHGNWWEGGCLNLPRVVKEGFLEEVVLHEEFTNQWSGCKPFLDAMTR